MQIALSPLGARALLGIPAAEIAEIDVAADDVCDADGEENIVLPILEKLGYNPQRAKTNIGLGRKVIRDLSGAAPVAQSKEMVTA